MGVVTVLQVPVVLNPELLLSTVVPPSLGRRAAALARRGSFHLMERLGHVSLVGHRPEIVNGNLAAIIRVESGM